MLTPLFLATRQRIVPCTTSVRYEAQTDTGFSAAVQVNRAESRPIAVEDREIAGAFVGTRTRQWNLPADQIPGVELKPGDKFTDAAGTVWRVNFAELQLSGTRWKLLCVRHQEGG